MTKLRVPVKKTFEEGIPPAYIELREPRCSKDTCRDGSEGSSIGEIVTMVHQGKFPEGRSISRRKQREKAGATVLLSRVVERLADHPIVETADTVEVADALAMSPPAARGRRMRARHVPGSELGRSSSATFHDMLGRWARGTADHGGKRYCEHRREEIRAVAQGTPRLPAELSSTVPAVGN